MIDRKIENAISDLFEHCSWNAEINEESVRTAIAFASEPGERSDIYREVVRRLKAQVLSLPDEI